MAFLCFIKNWMIIQLCLILTEHLLRVHIISLAVVKRLEIGEISEWISKIGIASFIGNVMIITESCIVFGFILTLLCFESGEELFYCFNISFIISGISPRLLIFPSIGLLHIPWISDKNIILKTPRNYPYIQKSPN